MAAGAAALASALSLQDLPEAYRYILSQPQIAGSQMVRPSFPFLRRPRVLSSRRPLTPFLSLLSTSQVTEIMQLPSEQRDVLVVRLQSPASISSARFDEL